MEHTATVQGKRMRWMKLKYLALSVVATFLISLLFSVTIVQAETGILTETRRSALITTLSRSQFEDGGFPSLLFPLNESESGAYETALVLYIARALESMDKIDLEKAVNYLISKQNLTMGNQTLWGWPGFLFNHTWGIVVNDPYVVHVVLNALGAFDAMEEVNKTALIELALSRYNESEGAFHEPVVRYTTPFLSRMGRRRFSAFPSNFTPSATSPMQAQTLSAPFLEFQF